MQKLDNVAMVNNLFMAYWLQQIAYKRIMYS